MTLITRYKVAEPQTSREQKRNKMAEKQNGRETPPSRWCPLQTTPCGEKRAEIADKSCLAQPSPWNKKLGR